MTQQHPGIDVDAWTLTVDPAAVARLRTAIAAVGNAPEPDPPRTPLNRTLQSLAGLAPHDAADVLINALARVCLVHAGLTAGGLRQALALADAAHGALRECIALNGQHGANYRPGE